MYNSFLILLLGTVPFLIAGLPVGYWLNVRLSEHPAAEVTYAYALFSGYILYTVPSMYLARAGIPVWMFAWILPAAAAAGLVWFLLRVNLLMTEVTSLYLPCGRTTLLSVFHIRLFA